MIMRYFIRFVMFLIYIDIVFVLLVFMVPTEMMCRWSDGKRPYGYVSCLSSSLGYPDNYRYTWSDFFKDLKQGWYNFK